MLKARCRNCFLFTNFMAQINRISVATNYMHDIGHQTGCSF